MERIEGNIYKLTDDEIIKINGGDKRWNPKYGETYFYFDSCGRVMSACCPA